MFEFQERAKRRRQHPDIVTLMCAMALAVEKRGQDARVTIGGLHQTALACLRDTRHRDSVLEQLYLDAMNEDAPGYAIPNFWKVAQCLWRDHWVSWEVSCRANEIMYAEKWRQKTPAEQFNEVSEDVDFAFDYMLKQEGHYVQMDGAWRTFVRSSTYEVS